MFTDEFGHVAPPWLSQFVRDELRPLIRQNRKAAQGAVRRWLNNYREQTSRRKGWQARRDDFLRRLSTRPSDKRPGPQQRSKGFTWCEYWRDPVDGILHRIRSWLPPELSVKNEPVVDWPLPLPKNRDLTPDECWAVLVAVHDAVRDPREKIIPTAKTEKEQLGLFPYSLLEGSVLASPGPGTRRLKKVHLARLREMLRVISPKQSSDENVNSDTLHQYVTLDQMAAMVGRSKKTLEREGKKKTSKMPRPDVQGGGGKPHEWKWSQVRPWLMKRYGRALPEQFPTGRRVL
jgi:hypothetical protein